MYLNVKLFLMDSDAHAELNIWISVIGKAVSFAAVE